MNILFVCSKNKWRSRTAETIFRDHPQHEVKSAGTDAGARVRLTAQHLAWAELICVMEDKHRQLIQQRFSRSFDDKIIVLDIPDDYQYMDEELITILKASVSSYLDYMQ